jgi:hypothetical protein
MITITTFVLTAFLTTSAFAAFPASVNDQITDSVTGTQNEFGAGKTVEVANSKGIDEYMEQIPTEQEREIKGTARSAVGILTKTRR